MLRFRIAVVDKTRTSFLSDGEKFYLTRLRRYVKTEWIEVKPSRMTKGRPEGEILRQEGEALLKHLQPGDIAVPLDRTGEEFDSPGLAVWLRMLGERPGGAVCFMIGGPLGHGREILERSQAVISLSRLTYTHEMARLVLLEQLYRACTIMAGEKYHK